MDGTHRRPERRPGWHRRVIAVTLAALLGALAFVPAPANASALEEELTELAEKVRLGVVAIEAVRRFGADDGRCVGSGVLLPGGRIVTTLYVAGPGDDIRIRYGDGHTTTASVVAVDPHREVSILQPSRIGGEPLVFAPTNGLNAGSWVFVVGFCLNTPEASLSIGRYSSRTIFAPDDIELLQLEAQVYPGHSGGAVINPDGEMVGLVFGGLGSEGFLNPVVLSSFGDESEIPNPLMLADRPLGIGFALPADVVQTAITRAEALAKMGTPYLGVRVTMTGKNDHRRVVVREVVPQSPAARAGVRPGEFIVAVDGVPVTSDSTLMEHVLRLSPGVSTRLTVDHPRGRASGEDVREIVIELGDYTTDYRMRLIRQRILAGRTSNLRTAKARLTDHLEALDAELNQVTAVSESVAR